MDRSGRLCELVGDSGKVDKSVGRSARLWEGQQDCQRSSGIVREAAALSGGLVTLSGGWNVVREHGRSH